MSFRQKIFVTGALLLTLGGTALRIIQYVFAIDPTTGYYALNSTSVLALQILSLIAVLLFLSSMFALKNEFVSVNGRFNNSFLNLSSMFLLITTAASVYLEITDILTGKLEPISLPYIVAALLLMIFCLLLIFTDIKKIHPLFYLVPVLYCTIRLIELFIKYTGIAHVSSRTFDVLTLCSLVLFFLYYSKSVVDKGGLLRTFAFGLCSLFFIAISVIPALIFMRKPDESVSVQAFLINNAHFLSFALFTLSILIPSRETKAEYQKYTEELYEKEHKFDIDDDDEYLDEEEEDEY